MFKRHSNGPLPKKHRYVRNWILCVKHQKIPQKDYIQPLSVQGKVMDQQGEESDISSDKKINIFSVINVKLILKSLLNLR